ncbi:fasciclin domain-containing protein [Psychromarinibacter halotolerans]|uniref:Fasciclin domain-containing protein n=1 Tax=Psychromarinibacter halotolerans TaxID=1775175 RepID=A0ABV7GUZ6_9RHOB|nr:fasciclin domain-containing protein [Psychromarinibacter halotolerans]MDF0594404.1 fasciclin domain-containing protein [Psychromarinibacter halotolerans]
MFKTIASAAVLMTATAGFAAAQGNPTVGGAPMMADMTIAENASAAPNLTTLVAAVTEADMVDTLMSAGPFTVFAPTNAAFGEINAASLEKLLANKPQLQQVLGCHVVATEAFSQDIAGMIADDGGMHPVETVGGCTLTAYMEGGMLKLKDENGRVATVTVADVDQSNGVVHVIDKVLIPAGQVN